MAKNPANSIRGDQNEPQVSVAGEVTQLGLLRSSWSSRTVRSTNATPTGNSLLRQIAKGVSYQMVANLFSQAGTFLSLLIVARLLGKTDYGRFVLVQSTVVTFTSVAALGLGITATKYVSQFRSTDPDRAGRVLGLSSSVAMISACCFAVAYLVASPYLVGQAQSEVIRIGAISVAFVTLNGYQLGALVGFESFRLLACVSGLAAIANPVIAASLTTKFGLAGAVAALGSNAFLVWAIYQFAVRAECRKWNFTVSYRGLKKESHILLSMAAPASVSGVISSGAIWAATLILARQHGGYAHLAIFSAANSLRLIVMFFPNVLNRVMMPTLNSLLANGDRREFDSTFRASVALSGGVAFGFALVFVMLRREVLSLFGKEFVDSDGVIPMLLFATVIEVIAGSIYTVIFVHGRMWRQVLTIGIWAASLILVTNLLASSGAVGLAGAYAAAWTVSLVLYSYHAWSLRTTLPVPGVAPMGEPPANGN